MFAALRGCRGSVDTLLQLGADPDILASGGESALFSAIQAGDQVITEKLAPFTTKGEAHGGEINRLVIAFRIITMYGEVV